MARRTPRRGTGRAILVARRSGALALTVLALVTGLAAPALSPTAAATLYLLTAMAAIACALTQFTGGPGARVAGVVGGILGVAGWPLQLVGHAAAGRACALSAAAAGLVAVLLTLRR